MPTLIRKTGLSDRQIERHKTDLVDKDHILRRVRGGYRGVVAEVAFNLERLVELAQESLSPMTGFPDEDSSADDEHDGRKGDADDMERVTPMSGKGDADDAPNRHEPSTATVNNNTYARPSSRDIEIAVEAVYYSDDPDADAPSWTWSENLRPQVQRCAVALYDEGATQAEVQHLAENQLKRTYQGRVLPTPDIWVTEFRRMRDKVRDRLSKNAGRASDPNFDADELFEFGWRHWLNTAAVLTANALPLEASVFCPMCDDNDM